MRYAKSKATQPSHDINSAAEKNPDALRQTNSPEKRIGHLKPRLDRLRYTAMLQEAMT